MLRILSLVAVLAAFSIAPAAAQAVPEYGYVEGTHSGVPQGTTDIGNHCNNCLTNVALPFPVTFYGNTYTSANVSSNGNVQFETDNPMAANGGGHPNVPSFEFGPTIFAWWSHLTTDGPSEGIFTATTGTAPARDFVIEWRAGEFERPGGHVSFAVVLHEDSDNVDVYYGPSSDEGATAGSGVQYDSDNYTRFSLEQPWLTDGLRLTWIPGTDDAGPPLPGTAVPTRDFTSLTLRGTVNPNGRASTYHFEWGTESGSYPNRTPDGTVPAGNSAVPVEAQITGLEQGRAYYFRLVASNSFGARASLERETSTLWPTSCSGPGVIVTDNSTGDSDPTVGRIVGTGQADFICGSPKRDFIDGMGGNDEIRGGDGNDVLMGNTGRDTVRGEGGADNIKTDSNLAGSTVGSSPDQAFGGPGSNAIAGGPGNDELYGGPNGDAVNGQEGNDSLEGGPGDDDLTGGAGYDWLIGGENADRLRGSGSADILWGGEGPDLLLGDTGNDSLAGQEGDDTLKGERGVDEMFGEAGNDQLDAADGAGGDTSDCGEDVDTLRRDLSDPPGVGCEVDTIVP